MIAASLCIKCGEQIPSETRSVKYCSPHCSKLYLKSEYRKRRREHCYLVKNEWRRAKNGGNRPLTWPAKRRDTKCLKCGTEQDLQLAHVKPLAVGGTHQHLVTFCRRHHYQFDKALRSFWFE